MKIQLPDPNDFLHKEDQFFDQLELCIFHAKKAWDKIRKTYPAEDATNYPWLSFNHEDEINAELEEVDPDFLERQKISIEINEL